MELNRYCVKVFAEGPINVLDSVPVFHRWIREKLVKDHMLIDVADYSHVWQGPGVMLVSHEANFSLDQEGGRLGLFYQRKTAFDPGVDPLKGALRAALEACSLLEDEAELKIRFPGAIIDLSANDRSRAPMSEASLRALEKQISAFLPQLYKGSSPKLTRNQDSRERPRITVASSEALGVKTLLQRLA